MPENACVCVCVKMRNPFVLLFFLLSGGGGDLVKENPASFFYREITSFFSHTHKHTFSLVKCLLLSSSFYLFLFLD